MPIDLLTLSAAFIVGLAGGIHCIAMCGGIAVGLAGTEKKTLLPRALLSNIGRVLGYVLAGAIAGGLGHGIVRAAQLAAFQNWVRLMVGLILFIAAIRIIFPAAQIGFFSQLGNRLWMLVQPLHRGASRLDGSARHLALGMLWGWLPCGLSVTMLGAAWFEASALHGALLMLFFGLGTLPVMTSIGWSGARLFNFNNTSWRIAAGVIVATLALLTLLAPWLAKTPEMHGILSALGCRTLQSPY